MSRHLTATQIGRFVDRTLDELERGRVAAHLAGCDDCRADAVATGRVLRGSRETSMYGPLATLLAAAVVAAVLLVRPWAEDETAGRRALRDAPATRAAVEVVEPAEGGVARRFVWRSADPEALYRFTLVSPAGEVLHSATVPDTALVLPEDVVLPAGESYWVVDALLPGGLTRSTGAHRVRPPP